MAVMTEIDEYIKKKKVVEKYYACFLRQRDRHHYAAPYGPKRKINENKMF